MDSFFPKQDSVEFLLLLNKKKGQGGDKKEEYSNVLDLPSDHPAVIRYLKGETLDIPEAEACESGWVLVCCDGYPLGWGKCVNGTLRNKYQAGWRMQ